MNQIISEILTKEVTGIAYDSRKVEPGNIFVAIPGLKADGNEFIPQAIEKGATAIVIEKELEPRPALPAGRLQSQVPSAVTITIVPSARKALAELAAEFYGNPSEKLKLIGITGTKGKTTVSYLIQSILKKAGYKAEVIGTINASMTTPDSVELQKEFARMVKEGVTHCILEVSSHALAQERVLGCRFEVAIFTNLSHDHLDYHKTMEEYFLTKAKLFEMLDPNSFAIINIDDPYGEKLLHIIKSEVVTYGIDQQKHELRNTKYENDFDTRVKDVHISGSEMTLRINNLDITTPFIGLHNAYNIAAAYECGLVLGIHPKTIKKGLESLKVIPGRQEKVECGQPFEVIVDFAHSPDSLEKLLQTYKPLTRGKLILVFGCPGDRDRLKRPIMGEIAAKYADVVIVTTDDPHSEDPEKIIDEVVERITCLAGRQAHIALRITDRKQAIVKALESAKPGDIVLIAGRGHEKYQDFNGKKVEIDDRHIAREILKNERKS
jgi:UDP-N-acetylmuramoyl-L-alanyl-D-glutamate--2,6-diaminopimelate ligase